MLSLCTTYYVRGQDLPAVPSQQGSVVVHLPRNNVLTPQSLEELMKEAAQWRHNP
jgi:hypothetical protein